MRQQFFAKNIIMAFMVFLTFGCDNKTDSSITIKWG